jgi:hypothetical protein
MCGSFLHGNREVSWLARCSLSSLVRGGKARSVQRG